MMFAVGKGFKVMPGVRMTVSKGGVSTSAVVRGARAGFPATLLEGWA